MLLAEFDFAMEYKPRKVNLVADALSRRYDLEFISRPEGPLLSRIKERLSHDPTAQSFVQYAKKCKSKRFFGSRATCCTLGGVASMSHSS